MSALEVARPVALPITPELIEVLPGIKARVVAIIKHELHSVLTHLLDRAGVPEGVDASWQSKHFLGAPVVGAPLATLNLEQITMVAEFAAAEIVETMSGTELAPALAAVPADPAEKEVLAIGNVGGAAEPVSAPARPADR